VLAPSTDPATLYRSRHEAAIAALKAANQIASLGRSNDRVIDLLLIAAKRDPHFGKVVYDLGVVCAKGERWDDAIRFYQRAPQVEPDQEVARRAADELERVQLVAKLESTTDGKRQRQFDTQFMEITKKANADAVAALDLLNRLANVDHRWEAPALQGVLQASLGEYAASSQALESAGRLAPADRRQALVSATKLAREEAKYWDYKRNAELAWDKQEYQPAAKLYSQAWETSQQRISVGMQAAVAYLMADQIGPAVNILTRIGQQGSPEYANQARNMLSALKAVSAEAAAAATMERHGGPEGPPADVADRIRTLVGDLTSPQMLLVGKAPPPFLQDNTPFIAIPDSEISGPEVAFLSTESIFVRYETVVSEGAQVPTEGPRPASAPATGTGHPTGTNPPIDTAPTQVSGRPLTLPLHPDSPSPKPAKGSDVGFAITSEPAGASVFFDNDSSTTCRTPCQLASATGRHTLVATLNGYRDVLKIVNFEKSGAAAPIELAFERRQGVIEVTGATGSQIYLDGNRTEQTTPGKLTVPEGDHEIGIEANNGVLKKTVRVRDEDWLRITF
jgi:tetratricopeptide (TPR) repeat protein